MPLKHLDLFSGIGGFALAAQAAGFETIGFAEIDNYASAILKRHWPNIHNYGDVRTVPAIQCDLITGGFPCQPFSVAGKQRGASDDRFLWPAMLDVIKKCQPAWVLGENVAGLVNMELDRCFSDLENLGYEVQPIVIPACAVDARHRRDRVWIIGYAKHARLTTSEISGSLGTGNDDSAPRTQQASEPAGSGEQLPSLAHAYRGRFGECEPETEQIHGIGGASESNREAPADADRRTGGAFGQIENKARTANALGGGGEPDGKTLAAADGVRQSGQRQHERQFNQEENRNRKTNRTHNNGEARQFCEWQSEPAIRRVANGIPNRVDKLRGLGNAIVPEVAETILVEMMRAMRQQSSGLT